MNRQQSAAAADLVAAYREGLGLAAVAVIAGAAGMRIAAAADAEDGAVASREVIVARWWCRRAGDAARIAVAARARLRRAQAQSVTPDAAFDAIARAARRVNVALLTEQDLLDELRAVVGRLDAEIARMQAAGELRSINAAYRTYRLETTARGERVKPYAAWMRAYRADVLRKIAAALRQC